MTREQEIKNNLCEYINNLTTKELFNITSHFEDILNPKIPDAATLRCEKCKQIYPTVFSGEPSADAVGNQELSG